MGGMDPSYDPKLVALTALGLACFAFGFSVTAVAYPSVSHAAALNHATQADHRAPIHDSASSVPNTAKTSRGCQLGE